MRSCLPAERALTWLTLSLEKLGLITPALALEPAAEPAPAIAATPSVAALTIEATFRVVNDIPLPPFKTLPGVPKSTLLHLAGVRQRRTVEVTRRGCEQHVIRLHRPNVMFDYGPTLSALPPPEATAPGRSARRRSPGCRRAARSGRTPARDRRG